MTRESLGQFRIYEYTCDGCTKVEKHSIRGSRAVKPPEGWLHLNVGIGDSAPREADVCSVDCAAKWQSEQVAQLSDEILERQSA